MMLVIPASLLGCGGDDTNTTTPTPEAGMEGSVADATPDVSDAHATPDADAGNVTRPDAEAGTTMVKTLIAVQVTPANATVHIGATQQYVATANYSDGTNTDVSATATWASTDATTATVSAAGLATGVKAGTTTVTATVTTGVGAPKTGTATVIVSPAALTSVSVTPATATVSAGAAQQFTARATYMDNTTADVTSQSTWASSSTATATVTMLGLATGVAAGNTTITATYSGMMGTAMLTVSTAVVNSISVTPALGNTNVGGADVTFTATAVLSDGTQSNVTAQATWTSSAAATATVSAAGVAHPVAAGTVTISAAFGGKTGTASLVVGTAVLTSVTVTTPNPSIPGGTTTQFTATAHYADNSTQNVTSQASWQSSATGVATIAATGLATGVTAGTSNITAGFGGMTSAPSLLTVTAGLLNSITISPATPQNVPVGLTVAFTAMGAFSDGTNADISTLVTWGSTPAGLLTFVGSTATGATAGVATVTATLSGKTSNGTTVTVTTATLVSIAVTPALPSALHVGATQQFTATGTFTDATTQDLTATAVWTSSTTAAATILTGVANAGLATGVAAGTTNITAASGTKTSPPVALAVSGATLVTITLTPATLTTLPVGQTRQFTATGVYNDSTSGDITATASWSATTNAGAATATFTVVNGLVTAVSSTVGLGANGAFPADQGLVKAALSGVSGVAPVKVTSTTINSIAVTCTGPGNIACTPPGVGFQVSCTALATLSDTSTTDVTTTATWASSDTTLASPVGIASAHELFSIVGAGTNGSSNITASVGTIHSPNFAVGSQAGQTIAATLTVTPAAATRSLGQTTQYSATASYTGAGACAGPNVYSVTPLSTWTSSDTTVATISNAAGSNGLASPVGAGTATIAAAFQGHSGNTGLTVSTACLQTLTVDQDTQTYPRDVFVPLTVKAVYSNSATPVQLDSTITPGNGWSGGTVTLSGTAWQLDTSSLVAGANTLTFTVNGGCAGAVLGTAHVTLDNTTNPTSLAITPATQTISLGGSIDYTATATYPGFGSFNVSQQAALTWGETPIAGTIGFGAAPNSLNERLTHAQGTVGAGSYTVSAAYLNQSASASLTIAGTRTITTVVVASSVTGTSTANVPVGLPVTFDVTVNFSDGNNQVNPPGVTFVSDTAGKLSAFSTNVATTLATGTTHVTASFGGTSSTPLLITVNANVLTSITAGNFTIPENDTTPVTVTGVYNAGAQSFNISALVSSSSSDTATVSVTTSAAGTSVTSHANAAAATLTFIKDAITGHATATVSGACITGLAITPTPVSLAQGTSKIFVATATFSDATTQDWTANATWSVTDAHLTRTANGHYTANIGAPALGADTVTATYVSGATTVCGGGNGATTTVTASASATVIAATVGSISLDVVPTTLGIVEIPFNETRQLVVTATLTDGSTQDVTSTTTFVAGSPTVVSVSASGLLTAHALAGTSIIQANYAPTSVSTQLTFTVADCGAPVVAITGTPVGTGNLAVGLTTDYSAQAQYDNSGGNCALFSNDEVTFDVTSLATWASDTTAVATINAGPGGTHPGRATIAAAGGPAHITATYKTVISNIDALTGITPTLTSIAISVAATTVAKGLTEQIVVTPTWSDGGHYATTVSFTFDPSKISIDGSSVLTALAAGTTTIQAHSGAVNSNTINPLTVSAACISGLTLSSATGTTLPVGVPFTVGFTCTTSDNSVLTCPTPGFATTNHNVVDNAFASFATTGHTRIKTGATAGNTDTITATIPINGACPAVTQTIDITAGAATLQSIALTPANVTIPVQTTQAYVTQGTYTGGTGAGTYDVSAASSIGSNNASVATAAASTATGVSAGTALVTSTYAALSATSNTVNLTVDTTKVLQSIAVTADQNLVGGGAGSAQYPVGSYNLQLHATGTYNVGPTADLTSQVTWAMVAGGTTGSSLSAGGLFTTGATGGVEHVTATQGTVASAAFAITVDAGTITTVSIVLSGGGAIAPPLSVPNGAQATLAARITSNTGGNPVYWVTGNFSWASSNAAVATVVATGASAGTVHAVAAAGTTNVTATRGSLTGGPLVVTGSSATPTSIVCAPAAVSVNVGSTAQLHATVTFSDATTIDETTSVDTTWTAVMHSAFNGVHDGVVTGTSAGTATISPSYSSGGPVVTATVGNSCVITVN